MSYLMAKISAFFHFSAKEEVNPVYDFFVLQKSRDKKRAYMRALKGAQKDQEIIMKIAREKIR